MLKQRILTAVILAPVVLAIVWYGNNLVFTALVSFLALMIGFEWCQVVKNARINSLIISFAIAICVWGFEFSGLVEIDRNRIFIAGIILWAICFIWLAIPSDGKNKYSIKYALGVGVLLIFSASLLDLHRQEQGSVYTMVLFFLIWIADIGAYVAGKNFGKNKLAIRISPGKTIEGLLGALIFTSVYGYIIAGYLEQNRIIFAAVFPLIAAISVIGDLFASLLKRQAGVKDSGFLLPGHGGFLDRFDSLIAATPFYYAFINFTSVHGA